MRSPRSASWWRWRIVTAALLAALLAAVLAVFAGLCAWFLWPRYVADGNWRSPDGRHRVVLVLRLIGPFDEMAVFGCLPGQPWQDGVPLCGWVDGTIHFTWRDDGHARAVVRDPGSSWWQQAEWDGVQLEWVK